MSTWKLTDTITNETTLVCSDSTKEAVEAIRKTNLRSLDLFDYAQELIEHGENGCATAYQSWAEGLHSEMHGMLKMFRLLTGIEISDVALLHDRFIQA